MSSGVRFFLIQLLTAGIILAVSSFTRITAQLPLLSGMETGSLVYTAGDGRVAVSNSIRVSAFSLSQAIIRISGGYNSNEDRLLFNNTLRITGTWNSSSGTLTLSGFASDFQYENALRSVYYENTNTGDPSLQTRIISFSVNNGFLYSNTVSRSVTVVNPYLPPVLSNIETGPAVFCPNSGPIVITSTLTVEDPDNTSLSSATVQITTGYTPGFDLLEFVDQNGISGAWNSASGILTLTGTASLTAYRDALRSIRYESTGSGNSPGRSLEVKYTVNDGRLQSNPVYREIAYSGPPPDVSISGLDPVYSQESTALVPLTGTPPGGEFSGPGVVYANSEWYFLPAAAPVGVHSIIYKYSPNPGSCYGYDTATVRVVEKSAAIQIENNRTKFCKNDPSFRVTGINLINSLPGSFSISGGAGLTDHGNNTATVSPSMLEINQYTITYTSFDGSTAQEIITIGEELKADFVWSTECFHEGQPVAFNNTSSSPFGFFTDDSYSWTVYMAGDSISRSSKDITSTFPVAGNYVIKLHVRNSNGCANQTEKVFSLRPVIKLATENYIEDFEELNDWSSENNPAIPVNSWRFGTPSEPENGFPRPYSGENCWFTNISVNPAPREESWITSPCFDFRGTEKPTLVARIWRSFTDNRDGADVRYSTDNGQHWSPVGTLLGGINWFNGYFGDPGDQSLGWTDINDNDWIEIRHILDFLKDEPVVQFRFTFNANGSAFGNHGIAVDDIRIVERNRTILIEHFTSSSDPESREADIQLNEIAQQAGTNLIDIQYHASDNNDPFYRDNPVIANTRQFYYGISDVPYAVINGGFAANRKIDYRNHTLSMSQIGVEALYDSDFNLNVTSMIRGDTLFAKAVLSPVNDIPLSELSVRMVVVEPVIDTLLGENSSVQRFRNVVRAMLPDASGNTLYRSWSKNDIIQITEAWKMQNIVNPDHVRVVVFIQNEMTKEIDQAALDSRGFIDVITTSVDQVDRESDQFSVFPNPARTSLHIEFTGEAAGRNFDIKLFNSLGKQVYSIKSVKGASLTELPVQHLPAGIYVLSIISHEGITGNMKIVITK